MFQNIIYKLLLDSCQVNNGGCDPNAACSHDSATNAVKCTCKTGYANTGTGAAVVCTGNSIIRHCCSQKFLIYNPVGMETADLLVI